jgi:hypothetical protein
VRGVGCWYWLFYYPFSATTQTDTVTDRQRQTIVYTAAAAALVTASCLSVHTARALPPPLPPRLSCRRSRAASHPHPHSPATSWERRSRGTRSVLRGRALDEPRQEPKSEEGTHCLVLPQPQPVIALHCLICCTVCLFRDDLPTLRAPYSLIHTPGIRRYFQSF